MTARRPERAGPNPFGGRRRSTDMTSCAVCGGDVEKSSPEETDYRDEEFPVASVEYEGERYEFCSEEHRREFEEHPEKYA